MRGPLLALAALLVLGHLVAQVRGVAVVRRRVSSPLLGAGWFGTEEARSAAAGDPLTAGGLERTRWGLADGGPGGLASRAHPPADGGLGGSLVVRGPAVLVAASLAAVVVGWLLGGPALGVLVVLGIPPARIAARRHTRTKARRAIDDELPALLESLAAGARSGATLPVALRDAAVRTRGALRDPLRRMVSAVDGGVPLAAALGRLAAEQPSTRVRAVVAALSLALRLGGAEARALDGLAASLCDRQAVDRELRALSAQARASAAVMVAAPLAFVGLSATGDPEALAFFTRTPAGAACLLAGIALDAAGAAWMWSVVRSVR